MQTQNYGLNARIADTASRGAGQRLNASSLLWWRNNWWWRMPPAVPFASARGRDS